MGEDALRANRLFDSYVDLHDRQHFEINFNYEASPTAARDDGTARFRVDAFFFLPTNLGVSALSYGKDDFFKDVLSYLRFKTPNLTASQLGDPLNPLSPLNILSFNLKQLVDKPEPDPRLEKATANEAKLLGCILIANWRDLRKQARELASALASRKRMSSSAAELIADIGNRLEAEHELLLRFRGIRRTYLQNSACLSKRTLDALRLVDEYLTYRFDENLAKIDEAFRPLANMQGCESVRELAERLRWLGEQEVSYRSEQDFLKLSAQDQGTLELYTYRTGALKKILGQVLYLDIETVREAQRFKSVVAACGAALAAFWSTLGDRNVNFRLHGVPTTVLILVIVCVYVLKDRIKDFFKEYLATQVQRLLPDQRLTVIDPLTEQRIGACRQTVRYEKKHKLAEDIRQIRDFTHALDLDETREEEVLSYRHAMMLDTRAIHATHLRRMHVKHILRYSVANLLRRLSDPHVRVPHFNDDTDRFEVVLAPKVYHVNVVFRVAQVNRGKLSDPVYHRVRVVLSKDGIERVEAVVLNMRLWEVEQLKAGRHHEHSETLMVSEAEDLSPS